MKVLRTIAAARSEVASARQRGQVTGLVPTMGALHEGHGELIRRARVDCGHVSVSIFVNPIQFSQAEDLDKYPRPFEADVAFCERLGVDAIFAPGAAEMYPSERLTSVDVARVSSGLCGDFRPGHFRGVATVVAKLFHILPADRAYFGEKDAQQLAVIRKMVADLDFPIEVVPVPTVRENDGLAMSSRNVRLSPDHRKLAPIFYQSLEAARARVMAGDRNPESVKQAALDLLASVPELRVEYLEVVGEADVQPVETIQTRVLIAAAVWLGGVRLIDNIRVGPAVLSPVT